MKLRDLFFFVFILLCSTQVFAQVEPQLAPLNPDFIELQKGKKLKSQVIQTKDGHSLGYIPSPVAHNFENLKVLKSTTALPVSYDLRTANGGNWLTSVKDQGQCGSCWTFAAMGAIESYALKQGFGANNLSEQNLATCHGFNSDPCSGGNSSMATAYFSRGTGPVSESDVPYTLPSNTSCLSGYSPVSYISEARFLSGIKSEAFDASVVKQAIIDFGALAVNMQWNDESYNHNDNTYFHNADFESGGHGILLIGWDDSKVVTGGADASPLGQGAWIIRNSWGPNWGDGGYFYISYEDTEVLEDISYYPSFNTYDPDAEINYIDQLGATGGTGWSDGTGFGLIKSTASQDQQIERIGTLIRNANTVVDIELFANFNGNSLSNSLGSLTGQVCEYPGYYTFNLPTPVEVLAGTDLYIRLKYNSGASYQIPIEYKVEEYADPVIETGKCWISQNGTSRWSALGQDTDYEWDLCIKSYAVPISDPTANLAEELNLLIYPNPIEDEVVVELETVGPYSVEILDLSGRVLYNEELINATEGIDLRNFTAGIYLMKIQANGKEYLKKIIKQ